MQVHEAQARLLLSAQALAGTVNPMLQPTGTLETPGLRVQWQAQPIESPRRNLGFAGQANGAFETGLYRMEVSARDLDAKVELRFEQWQVGTRRDAIVEQMPL